MLNNNNNQPIIPDVVIKLVSDARSEKNQYIRQNYIFRLHDLKTYIETALKTLEINAKK